MEQLTYDLQGVAVYLDDILVSGENAVDHLENLQQLIQGLEGNGLRCRLEKYSFAQPSVEYLGHKLTPRGVEKGYAKLMQSKICQSQLTPQVFVHSWDLLSFMGNTSQIYL